MGPWELISLANGVKPTDFANALSEQNKAYQAQEILRYAGYPAGFNTGYGGYGGSLYENASSTPVKLMQKFVNDRGWGSVDTNGMKDWRGNDVGGAGIANVGVNTNAAINPNTNAGRWAVLGTLLKNRG